jgi:hypothetical protein
VRLYSAPQLHRTIVAILVIAPTARTIKPDSADTGRRCWLAADRRAARFFLATNLAYERFGQSRRLYLKVWLGPVRVVRQRRASGLFKVTAPVRTLRPPTRQKYRAREFERDELVKRIRTSFRAEVALILCLRIPSTSRSCQSQL